MEGTNTVNFECFHGSPFVPTPANGNVIVTSTSYPADPYTPYDPFGQEIGEGAINNSLILEIIPNPAVMQSDPFDFQRTPAVDERELNEFLEWKRKKAQASPGPGVSFPNAKRKIRLEE